MTGKTLWESVKVEADAIADKLRELIHEGNVRRIRIVHQGRTVAEFPVTAGVVAVVLAPIAAAVGALVALLRTARLKWSASRNPKRLRTTSERPRREIVAVARYRVGLRRCNTIPR